jgi:hypothetical protein
MVNAPLGYRREALALVDGMRQVDVADPGDADLGHLEHGDRAASRVDQGRAPAHVGQRFGLDLVVLQQAGGAGLAPVEHSGDQLVAQRAGKGEFEVRQLVGHQARLVGHGLPARPVFPAPSRFETTTQAGGGD